MEKQTLFDLYKRVGDAIEADNYAVALRAADDCFAYLRALFAKSTIESNLLKLQENEQKEKTEK